MKPYGLCPNCGKQSVELEMNKTVIPFPICLSCGEWRKDIPEGALMVVVDKSIEREEAQ